MKTKAPICAEFDSALAAFTTATLRLRDVMMKDHTGDFFAANYPPCLPSFDEFAAQVQVWKGGQDEAAAFVEEEEAREMTDEQKACLAYFAKVMF